MTTRPDISDHARWRALLTIGSSGVRAHFYASDVRSAFLLIDTPIGGDPSDALAPIEDAVYSDPALLDDYDVAVLVRPDRMILLPAAEAGDEPEDEAARRLNLLDPRQRKDVWAVPAGEHVAMFTTTEGVKDFLARTFPTEDVSPALAPLLSRRPSRAEDAEATAMVHLDPGTLDIVVWQNGRLVLANTRRYSGTADAAYYIVYALQALGISPASTHIEVSAPSPLRGEILPMLRRHAGRAAGAILPTPVKEAVDKGLSLVEALKITQLIESRL